MTRRPKLSLEPDRQIRREPPRTFASVVSTDPQNGQGASNEQIELKTPGFSTTKRDAKSASASEGPASRTAPSASPLPPPRTPTVEQAPPSTRIDRSTLVKVLLAVGVAALSILLLKRRFY